MKRKIILIIIAIVLAVGIPIVLRKLHKPDSGIRTPRGIAVRVGYARKGTMYSDVEVSGNIRALKTVELSAKIPAAVLSIPYREGDRVGAGSVVLYQDASDLRSQVTQAEAGLMNARAHLSQAATAVGLSGRQVEFDIANAQAGLDAAKARLRMVKSGARKQEVASAENAAASAQANFNNAQATLERMRGLFSQGALSKQQMDLTQLQYDVAKSEYATAQEQLSLVKSGAREEEVEAAQKQVDQASEGLRMAKSSRANGALRGADVKSAKAGVIQAEAALSLARQQLESTSIRTPISGIVARRFSEPGQIANPGQPLMDIVDLSSVVFEAGVSEIDLHNVHIGQQVQILVDAAPGREYKGTVEKIYPAAEPASRQFTVLVRIANPNGELRQGMFARGKIRVARHDNAIIISKDALVSNGDGLSVYAVVGSRARYRKVRTGFETRSEAEVLSGVQSGDELVLVGQDKLSDGVKVYGTD